MVSSLAVQRPSPPASPGGFDEMEGAEGFGPREAYEQVQRWLKETPSEVLEIRRVQAEQLFRRTGITFNIYDDIDGRERLIPFDLVPRMLTRVEWDVIERGLKQRVTALNAFLLDIYGEREILRAGVVPEELVLGNPQYRNELAGLKPPKGVFLHVAGIDLVRTAPDEFYVLEDNTRTPSGVSYMLQNREMMLRLFPELLTRARVAAVETYPELLRQTLSSTAPDGRENDPCIVLLTPGQHNAAFFEHGYLADEMGVELVEGSDLFVRDEEVFMRTTDGPRRVDVIYRRVDDSYLDPEAFRPESIIGVPGLIGAYRSGAVTLANAPGSGVSDDKAVYTFVPEIIRFYTGEEPLLQNVPTYLCRNPRELSFVLAHLPELVVKEVSNSGGYGMLIGPHASRAEIEMFRDKLRQSPERFIAQPTLPLSTCPVFQNGRLERRHVDLRPFVLTGAEGVSVVPGGLTRVALTPGSLVVNSSQGGGAKDTWVLGS